MEKNTKIKPISALDLIEFKETNKKITCLTAYDYRTAQLIDEAGIDVVLVGDSLANVFLGLDSTTKIGMEEMIYHTQAVARGVKNALVVSDMPFLSYNLTLKEGITNAANLIKVGAKAVKLEGANKKTVEVIHNLTEIGIPVVGHLGFTPQSEKTLKGKVQGKTESDKNKIFEQAKEIQNAGAIALVLEMVPKELAKEISQALKIPTIGIGAGAGCDGQVLVIDDMLGKTETKFKFVKRYSEIGELISQATKEFIEDVQNGKFPSEAQSF